MPQIGYSVTENFVVTGH